MALFTSGPILGSHPSCLLPALSSAGAQPPGSWLSLGVPFTPFNPAHAPLAPCCPSAVKATLFNRQGLPAPGLADCAPLVQCCVPLCPLHFQSTSSQTPRPPQTQGLRAALPQGGTQSLVSTLTLMLAVLVLSTWIGEFPGNYKKPIFSCYPVVFLQWLNPFCKEMLPQPAEWSRCGLVTPFTLCRSMLDAFTC